MALQEAKWRAALGLTNEGQHSGQGRNKAQNKDTLTSLKVVFISTQGGKQNGPHLQCLTPEECTKLMQEGQCFRCREQGHQSKECPKKNEQGGGKQSSSNAQAAMISATPTQGASKAPP